MTSERVDPSTLIAYTASPAQVVADSGERVTLDDLVGGAGADRVASLVALHPALFPASGVLRPAIERDAAVAGDRGDLVVHQLLVSVDGRPAGFLLVDCNLQRGVAVVLFMGLSKPARRLTFGGHSFAAWLVALVLAHLSRDLDAHGLPVPGLGLVGEAVTAVEVRLWRGLGFRLLPVEYAEPAEGWNWSTVGLQLRDVSLVWLPPFDLDTTAVDGLEHDVAAAGAAAFLLDHYGLPVDHPLVTAAVGAQAARPGIASPRRG
ncbi:MAG: hypothetical protein ACO3C1_07115 [Ilumatobacteraceae bacterium]